MDGAGGLGAVDSTSPQVLDPPAAETIDGGAGGQLQPAGASSTAAAGGAAGEGNDASVPCGDSPALGAHVEEGPRAGEHREEEESLAVGVGGCRSEVELLGEELTCELQAGLAAMEVRETTQKRRDCRELRALRSVAVTAFRCCCCSWAPTQSCCCLGIFSSPLDGSDNDPRLMQAVAAREPGAAFFPRVARLLGDVVAKAAEAGPRLLAGALRLDDASDTLFLLLCRQVLRLPMPVSYSAVGTAVILLAMLAVCVCVCGGGGGGGGVLSYEL